MHDKKAIFANGKSNNMKKTAYITLFLSLGMLMSCHSGHDHEANHEEHEEEKSEHSHHPDAIIFEPEKAKAAGVEVSVIEPGEFNGVIHSSGKILAASDDESTVSATSPGVISFAKNISEGMPVSNGAVLFTISSSNLPEGDVQQRAYIAYETAKKEYERVQALIADRLITQSEFTAAESAYNTARVAYEGVGKQHGGKGVTVKANNGGYVKECLVKPGDYVEVGRPLLTITQNRRLNLRAEVPEREYNRLKEIRSAKFRTSSGDKIYNLDELNGKILSYGRTSGSTASYVPITFEFDNSSGILPGSYAEINLITGTRNDVISVPVEALTEEQGVMYVYLQDDEHSYRKQEVRTGDTDGERTEIVAGLKKGDKVVTRGAINVKLASAGKSIPGHTHNH